MRILAAVLVVPCLLASAEAAAQQRLSSEDVLSNRWKIPVESDPKIAGQGVTLPVIDYTAPDGSLKLKRGIVAGMEVAPNTTIGLGLFESMPKNQPSHWQPDNPMERKQKRSRKAAVGLSLSF